MIKLHISTEKYDDWFTNVAKASQAISPLEFPQFQTQSFHSKKPCSIQNGPASQQSFQNCRQKRTNAGLVIHRLFPAFKGGVLTAFLLHYIFLQANSHIKAPFQSLYSVLTPQLQKLAFLSMQCISHWPSLTHSLTAEVIKQISWGCLQWLNAVSCIQYFIVGSMYFKQHQSTEVPEYQTYLLSGNHLLNVKVCTLTWCTASSLSWSNFTSSFAQICLCTWPNRLTNDWTSREYEWDWHRQNSTGATSSYSTMRSRSSQSSSLSPFLMSGRHGNRWASCRSCSILSQVLYFGKSSFRISSCCSSVSPVHSEDLISKREIMLREIINELKTNM